MTNGLDNYVKKYTSEEIRQKPAIRLWKALKYAVINNKAHTGLTVVCATTDTALFVLHGPLAASNSLLALTAYLAYDVSRAVIKDYKYQLCQEQHKRAEIRFKMAELV